MTEYRVTLELRPPGFVGTLGPVKAMPAAEAVADAIANAIGRSPDGTGTDGQTMDLGWWTWTEAEAAIIARLARAAAEGMECKVVCCEVREVESSRGGAAEEEQKP